MILFNDEFLFVHNPKTAGTSLLNYLEITLPRSQRAGVKELGTHHPHLSMALGYACAKTGNRPADFKRILVAVRDPYARELSMYAYFSQVLSTSPGRYQDLNSVQMAEDAQAAASMPFGSYLHWLTQVRGTIDTWGSRYYFELSDGTVPPNLKVVQVEHLETQLEGALDGLERTTEAASLLTTNMTQHPSIFEAYDRLSAEIVFETYRWVFATWKYEPDLTQRALVAGHAA